MKQIKHITVTVDDYGWISDESCPCGNRYAHYLWMAAPEIKWIYVEDIGSYQGTVYAIGKYQRQWFVMRDYYGSCSGCGAWGEGGQPSTLDEVLSHGELFLNRKQAIEFVQAWIEHEYETPSEEFMRVLTGKATN